MTVCHCGNICVRLLFFLSLEMMDDGGHGQSAYPIIIFLNLLWIIAFSKLPIFISSEANQAFTAIIACTTLKIDKIYIYLLEPFYFIHNFIWLLCVIRTVESCLRHCASIDTITIIKMQTIAGVNANILPIFFVIGRFNLFYYWMNAMNT